MQSSANRITNDFGASDVDDVEFVSLAACLQRNYFVCRKESISSVRCVFGWAVWSDAGNDDVRDDNANDF